MRVPGWFSCVVIACALLLAACGGKSVTVPTVAAPRYPDFVRPSVPADLASSPAAAPQSRAWQLLQAGDLNGADREAVAALAVAPDFYPANITQGYVAVARRRADEAMTSFDRALALHGDDTAALVGRGQALQLLDRAEDALTAFESALAQDPSLVDVNRRIDVLRLQIVQRRVADARAAVRDGRYDEARSVYRDAIERSPESGFLHREFADVERDHGDGEMAIEHYRKAASLDPADTDALVALAEMLDARNDFDAAIRAYDEALAAGGPSELVDKREALRLRSEIARLPIEYRNIESSSQLTRGDLAALIGFRLPMLLNGAPQRDVGVITDIRGHWAESWMLAVATAGYMDPYDNHTFQPRTAVRRADLAQVVSRLLNRLAVLAPADAPLWQNARGSFTDLGATHIAYGAASAAVAAGIMTVGDTREFQPNGGVSGTEAVEVIRRLRLLADAVAPEARRQ